jgi:hypothetical protein
MSWTREQYLEVAKNAAALYLVVRDDLSGGHRNKMRGKALATFIMDQCEQILGQGAFDRPDYKPDMKNGGMKRAFPNEPGYVPLEMSKKELADRLRGSGLKVRE